MSVGQKDVSFATLTAPVVGVSIDRDSIGLACWTGRDVRLSTWPSTGLNRRQAAADAIRALGLTERFDCVVCGTVGPPHEPPLDLAALHASLCGLGLRFMFVVRPDGTRTSWRIAADRQDDFALSGRAAVELAACYLRSPSGAERSVSLDVRVAAALGALLSDWAREFSLATPGLIIGPRGVDTGRIRFGDLATAAAPPAKDPALDRIHRAFAELMEQAADAVQRDGFDQDDCALERYADMRHIPARRSGVAAARIPPGRSGVPAAFPPPTAGVPAALSPCTGGVPAAHIPCEHPWLRTPLPFIASLADIAAAFDECHARRTGYRRPGQPVEVAALGLVARVPMPKPNAAAFPGGIICLTWTGEIA